MCYKNTFSFNSNRARGLSLWKIRNIFQGSFSRIKSIRTPYLTVDLLRSAPESSPYVSDSLYFSFSLLFSYHSFWSLFIEKFFFLGNDFLIMFSWDNFGIWIFMYKIFLECYFSKFDLPDLLYGIVEMLVFWLISA